MKNAKKILFIILSICIFNSNTFVYATEHILSNSYEYDERVLPTVYDIPSTYSVGALGLGALGSGALSGVLGGAGVVVGGLLGAGALALGGYVVGKGLVNVYNYAKDWVISQSQVGVLDIEYTLLEDGGIQLSARDIPQDLVNSLNSSISLGVNSKLFGNLNAQHIYVKSSTSYSGYYAYMPDGVVYDSSVSCGASHSCYKVNNGSYQFYYNGTNYLITDFIFQTYSLRTNGHIGKEFSGSGYFYDTSLGKYIPFSNVRFIFNDYINIPVATTIDKFLYFSFQDFFTTRGLSFLDTESSLSLIEQAYYNSYGGMTIPGKYIGAANPGLTWNGKEWVNSDGDSIPPKDLGVPFPDLFNPVTGEFEYSDSISESLGGTTSSPDTSIPDSGTGWLSSIINAITSLPQSIYNFFDGIITGISNTLLNIWDWCQSIGSTISTGFSALLDGILSIPQSIINGICSLFIPVEGYFNNQLTELGDIFSSKIPLFGQVKDLLNAFKFDINAQMPKFEITLPKLYGGTTHQIIDFDYFVSYRDMILNFIRLFTWVPFLIKMYKKSIYLATGH